MTLKDVLSFLKVWSLVVDSLLKSAWKGMKASPYTTYLESADEIFDEKKNEKRNYQIDQEFSTPAVSYLAFATLCPRVCYPHPWNRQSVRSRGNAPWSSQELPSQVVAVF